MPRASNLGVRPAPRPPCSVREVVEEHNPGWTHVLWTDASADRFVAVHYPQFLATYAGYPLDIMRVDFLRYLWLYHFGGVYADLDYECYRPFAPLLSGASLVLGWEWAQTPRSAVGDARSVDLGTAREWHRAGNTLGNALMASVPRHPLLLSLLNHLRRTRPSSSVSYRPRWVWGATGPELLTRMFLGQARPEWNYRLADNTQLYPLSWQPPTLDDGFRSVHFPLAYGAHHFAGTWWQPQPTPALAGVSWREVRRGRTLSLR